MSQSPASWGSAWRWSYVADGSRVLKKGQVEAYTDQPELAEQPGVPRGKLTRQELNQLAGEELPERAAMSLVNANLAIPVNVALAANVLSDNATAYADAIQQTPIDQST